MPDLSKPQRLLCCNLDCSTSNFILSNNLSVSSVKDHNCLHSPPTSSIIYITASSTVYPDAFSLFVTALMNCPTLLAQYFPSQQSVSNFAHLLIHLFLIKCSPPPPPWYTRAFFWGFDNVSYFRSTV